MAKNEKIGHFAIKIFRIPAGKNDNVTPLRVSIRSQESISEVVFVVGRTSCNIGGFWPTLKSQKKHHFYRILYTDSDVKNANFDCFHKLLWSK